MGEMLVWPRSLVKLALGCRLSPSSPIPSTSPRKGSTSQRRQPGALLRWEEREASLGRIRAVVQSPFSLVLTALGVGTLVSDIWGLESLRNILKAPKL